MERKAIYLRKANALLSKAVFTFPNSSKLSLPLKKKTNKHEKNKEVKKQSPILYLLSAMSFSSKLKIIQVSYFNMVKYATEFQPSPEGLQMYMAGIKADTELY